MAVATKTRKTTKQVKQLPPADPTTENGSYLLPGEFKGNPTLSIMVVTNGKEYRALTFGIRKAAMIADHASEIRAWVEEKLGLTA